LTVSKIKRNGKTISYAYDPRGVRIAREVDGLRTIYLLDGADVAAEIQSGAVVMTYLHGANPIRINSATPRFYSYNAHGDVVQLTNATTGAVTKNYSYDAFGNEKTAITGVNPYRYCGEYNDLETGMYYLRARYYEPRLGRFTQQDTHWTVANMIYGDNPQKINERQDALGLKTYTCVPQLAAVMQAGNQYVYGVNNPNEFADPSGEEALTIATFAIIIIGASTSGAISGLIASTRGDRFAAGFASGFLSTIGTECGLLLGPVGAVVFGAVGGAIGSLAYDKIQGGISEQEMFNNAFAAFVRGGLIGVGSAYWDAAIKVANEMGSAANLLMKYDPIFGSILKQFFSQLSSAMVSEMGYQK